MVLDEEAKVFFFFESGFIVNMKNIMLIKDFCRDIFYIETLDI